MTSRICKTEIQIPPINYNDATGSRCLRRVFTFVIHRRSACSIVLAQNFGYFFSSASDPSISQDACDDRLTATSCCGSFLTTLFSAALQVAPCYPWRTFNPMIGVFSTSKRRVTTTHFRACLDSVLCSQAWRLGYHTFYPISGKTKPWCAPDMFSGASAPEKLPYHRDKIRS